MKKLLLTVASLATVLVSSHAQFKMYGMTSSGGANGLGVVFSITPGGAFTKVADMNPTYAAAPYGSLLFASDNNFYGMSFEGGYNDSCTMFQCTPAGALTTEINMDTVWGSSSPVASLIQANDGNLYGMTNLGGDSSNGVIFQYVIATHKYKAIYNFGYSDGGNPYGDLVQASDGFLYGMTFYGGIKGVGTIFKCSLSGVFTKLFDFDSTSGYSPLGSLIQATDGYLYGMTQGGGANNSGTIFKCSTAGAFTKIYDFTKAGGDAPTGSLIQATDGYLYGMTDSGGASNLGVIFRCSTSGVFTKLLDFNAANGSYPEGSLTQGSDGLLYGMTTFGGSDSAGTVFKCTTGGSLTTLFNFDNTNGANPLYGRVIEVTDMVLNTNNISSQQPAIYPNPSNGDFFVQLPQNTGGTNFMEIYNELGERVYSNSLAVNSTIQRINMGSPAKGVYLYRILAENGNILGTGKLLVQ